MSSIVEDVWVGTACYWNGRMRRVLCVWFPNWPIQRLQNDEPSLRQRPLVVFAEHGSRGLRVVACSTDAMQQGVHPDLPVAEARALLSTSDRPPLKPHQRTGTVAAVAIRPPAWKRADPVSDRTALQRLAQSCQRYTPLVGLDDSDHPEALLLDIAGCAHLYGDESGLLKVLTREMAEAGWQIRTAIADTIGAAWAMAHAGISGTILPPGDPTPALAKLPIAALRVESSVIETLQRLDLRTVEQVLSLPRSTLPARFGPKLGKRFDQASGLVHEDFLPERAVEPLMATWNSDHPVRQQAGIEFVFSELLRQLLEHRTMQRAGILELACEMQTETESHSIAFRLSRPTTDQRHLRQLFQLRCEREAWTSGMLSMQLTADRVGWLAEQQSTLFEDQRDQHDRELSSLIERLNSRLGEQAVLRPVMMPEVLPEWSWREEPWLTSSPSASSIVAAPLVLHSRPWQLEHVPQPIQVLASFPEGPPQHLWFSSGDERVREWWGPERIETGWWRKTDVLRDYFRIETETGAHFWIFRERKTGTWFLHGRFD